MGLFSPNIKDPKLKQILRELEKTQKELYEADNIIRHKTATDQVKSIAAREKVTFYSGLKKKINNILGEF